MTYKEGGGLNSAGRPAGEEYNSDTEGNSGNSSQALGTEWECERRGKEEAQDGLRGSDLGTRRKAPLTENRFGGEDEKLGVHNAFHFYLLNLRCLWGIQVEISA